MSKELEALDDLFGLVAFQGSFEKAQKYFDIIEQALQRLEAIDNAEPSEAMECILDIENNYKFYVHNKQNIEYQCNTIKQALRKLDHLEFMMDLSPNQISVINNREVVIMRKERYEEYREQEKVLEIIKKHFIIKLQEETELNGNVWGRLVSVQAKDDEGEWDCTACANLVDYEEEFDLLKRYCDENGSE